MKVKILAITLVVTVVSVLSPSLVFAQSNCPNPGPYGICPPVTDIAIGSIVIDDQVLTLSIAGMFGGILLISNGYLLLNKLPKRIRSPRNIES